MNRKQRGIIGIFICIWLLALLPTSSAFSGSMTVAAGAYNSSLVYIPALGYDTIVGTYSANSTVDAFITDNSTLIIQYSNTGNISDDVLWKNTGLSGSIDVIMTNESAMYILVFGNINGSTGTMVIYDVSTAKSAGIPGFELIITGMGIGILFSIHLIRRKSNE